MAMHAFVMVLQLAMDISKESGMANTKPTVENGTCEISSNNPSVATLICNSGYKPDGSVTSQLLPDIHGTMNWNPPELKCISMTTNTVPDVQNGTLDPVQRNNQITVHPYQSFDTVLPKCHNGYEFNGTKAILLPNHDNSQLIWTPSTLLCKPKQTVELPDVKNGTLIAKRTYPDTEYTSPRSLALNDYVNLKCNPGHTSKQFSSTLSVDTNNQLVWDPAILSCDRMTLMKDPPTLVNGFYTIDKSGPFFHGDKAKIHCYPGFKNDYEKIYGEVIEKGHQLIWYPELLHCQPMTLDTLPDIENGTSAIKNSAQYPYHVGTQATITCHAEHVTAETESKIIIDPQTGTLKWEPDNIRCRRINCPEPLPPPVLGTKEGKGRQFGDWIKYTCPPNYEVIGERKDPFRFEPILNPEYKCNPEGNWIPELPETFQCERVHCPELKKPKWTYLIYSRVLDGIATYTCVVDKTMVTRTCQADQTWSGQEPKCRDPTAIPSRPNLIWILPIFLIICLIVFFMIRQDRPNISRIYV